MNQTNKSLVEARLPTNYGTFRIIAFPGDSKEKENLALVMGEVEGRMLVRVHSAVSYTHLTLPTNREV